MKLAFHRQLIRDRKLAQAERERKIQARILQEENENDTLFQAALRKTSGLSEQNTYLMVVPTGRVGSVPAMPDRIQNYREHLQKVVEQAEVSDDKPEMVLDQNFSAAETDRAHQEMFLHRPQLKPISDNLCYLCKGACCSSGQDHAYLSPMVLRRFMEANPDLSGEEIVSMYVSRVAPEVIENSCINHTENGCSLPRYLRSDICNAYFCDPILNYHRECEKEETTKTVFAIQREYISAGTMDPDADNDVIVAAIVNSEGVEPFG